MDESEDNFVGIYLLILIRLFSGIFNRKELIKLI